MPFRVIDIDGFFSAWPQWVSGIDEGTIGLKGFSGLFAQLADVARLW